MFIDKHFPVEYTLKSPLHGRIGITCYWWHAPSLGQGECWRVWRRLLLRFVIRLMKFNDFLLPTLLSCWTAHQYRRLSFDRTPSEPTLTVLTTSLRWLYFLFAGGVHDKWSPFEAKPKPGGVVVVWVLLPDPDVIAGCEGPPSSVCPVAADGPKTAWMGAGGILAHSSCSTIVTVIFSFLTYFLFAGINVSHVLLDVFVVLNFWSAWSTAYKNAFPFFLTYFRLVRSFGVLSSLVGAPHAPRSTVSLEHQTQSKLSYTTFNRSLDMW
jgi:hypothetical protein